MEQQLHPMTRTGCFHLAKEAARPVSAHAYACMHFSHAFQLVAAIMHTANPGLHEFFVHGLLGRPCACCYCAAAQCPCARARALLQRAQRTRLTCLLSAAMALTPMTRMSSW